ncbi:MAG TPA: methyltransferase domain-containing protein [Stellaceae bacterium]|nr:methyltransferase domain-containing protein [Stellaceae bacterium]
MASEHDSDWQEYYERTAGRPPRRTLLLALERFGAGSGRSAVDLGCGDGRDTVELLRRGWRVLAIDAELAALERLRHRADLPPGAAVETRCQRFEDADWPAADLVNASFSLPLVPPARFPALWAKIAGSLKPGGRFSGQLFGERDGWRGEKAITFLGRAELERLLAGFAVELLEEEESDGPTPYGKPKHWHLFHIVARKGTALTPSPAD